MIKDARKVRGCLALGKTGETRGVTAPRIAECSTEIPRERSTRQHYASGGVESLSKVTAYLCQEKTEFVEAGASHLLVACCCGKHGVLALIVLNPMFTRVIHWSIPTNGLRIYEDQLQSHLKNV